MAKYVFPVTPTEKEREVLNATEYEVLISGNKGGGKTISLVMKIYFDCMNNKRIHWGFFRRTLKETRETFLRYALAFFPKGTFTYKVAQNRIVFPTGSYVSLNHIENDKDLLKYQGFSFHRVGFDESTSFTEHQIGYIKAQVRSDNPKVPAQIFYCTNPGGISHGFFKSRFVDGKKDGVAYPTPETEHLPPEQQMFMKHIKIMLIDNPYLMQSDPNYVRRLEELSDQDKEALLYGSWDITAGLFFNMWNKNKHIIKDYVPTKEDSLFISCDWGTAKPFAIGWFAVRPDQHVVMYREYYGIKGSLADEGIRKPADVVAKEIAEMTPENEKIKYMVLGHDCFTNTGYTNTIAEIMQGILQQRKIFIIRGYSERINGFARVKHYLRDDPETGIPFFQVTESCKHFIRTFPNMMDHPTKDGDIDDRQEDHVADMVKNFICSRPTPPKLLKARSYPQFSVGWFKEKKYLEN